MSDMYEEAIESSSSSTAAAIFKLLFFSFLGLFFFFVHCIDGQTPLSWGIKLAKVHLGTFLSYFVVLATIILMVAGLFFSKVPMVRKIIGKDGPITKSLYVIGSVIGIMVLFKIGPDAVVTNENTGPLGLMLAYTVFVTVMLSSLIVALIINFGLLQFCGTLMEPIMRPLYKMPGYAALDSAIGFVCSAAVGVFEQNRNYLNKLYTQKEAGIVATNFALHSLGFYVVLCEIAGIPQYYAAVTATSVVLAYIMPIFTSRVPPLSGLSDNYHDGTPPKPDVKDNSPILAKAWNLAVETSRTSEMISVVHCVVEAFVFSLKIGAYVLAIATLAMIIGEYTPVWTYVGMPMIPVLELFRIPNAAEIAPAVLVGVTEIAMPAVLIAGKGVAPAASFFIIVLCTLQLVSFTESANAIMESDIPLGFKDLLLCFVVRTIFAIPLTALATHLLFTWMKI